MMAYEMKPNTGSLFVNDRREKDTQPNARGSALIDGVEYWVSAWTNTTAAGDKYQSLKFQRKDEAPVAVAPVPELAVSGSDIPF
jgi:hypothetical protein